MRDDPPQLISWPEVVAALAPARNYWLNTINRDGSPQVSPVWGVVVDEHLCFYASRVTLKARNLAQDSRTVLHLESAEDVVIVYGHVEDLGEPSLFSEVMSVLRAKYDEPGDVDYLPGSSPSSNVLYRFQPRRALLWRLADFESSQRRWTVNTSL